MPALMQIFKRNQKGFFPHHGAQCGKGAQHVSAPEPRQMAPATTHLFFDRLNRWQELRKEEKFGRA